MKEPNIFYATPEKEIPILDEHNGQIGYFYVQARNGDEVRGMDLTKVVKMGAEKFDAIEMVGRIG